MNQFKRAQVVMLPTNHKSNIGLYKNKRLYFNQNLFKESDFEKNFNLYIISDDEIKEGDWIKFHVKPINKEWIYQVTKQDLIDYSDINNEGKKIIATTDTSLKVKTNQFGNPISFERELPQPSQQFIEKYIQAYNKGEVITDVLVEYKYIAGGRTSSHSGWKRGFGEQLKVNPKDNTITIKKLKDNWNREEVHNLMMQAWIFGQADKSLDYTIRKKWIEKNL